MLSPLSSQPSCSAEIGTAFSGAKEQKSWHELCPCMVICCCVRLSGCWAFPWVGRDSGAAEPGDFSIGSREDKQGVCRGHCPLELENSTCFCGHQQDPLITPPVGLWGRLCQSTLLPPERLIPEKEVEEESCSAFKSPRPKMRKMGDEGGGGSHSSVYITIRTAL